MKEIKGISEEKKQALYDIIAPVLADEVIHNSVEESVDEVIEAVLEVLNWERVYQSHHRYINTEVPDWRGNEMGQ
jgi:hypothetical protein